MLTSFASSRQLLDEAVHGAAIDARRQIVVSWGTSLRVWSMPQLTTSRAVGPPVAYGKGGCLLDGFFIGVSQSRLLAVDLDKGHTQLIDNEADVHDCIAATLFGRRGVLTIQRGMQVRFYTRQARRWTRREVYSIYTPSYQGGLTLSDVNNDGLIDIICGNYWIESPTRFEQPWRLFAIQTWFEEQDSATLRVAVRDAREIVAAQAHRSPSRISMFRAPEDVRRLWTEIPLWPRLNLHQVHGLALWRTRVVAGENNGEQSRIVVDGDVLDTGFPVLALLPLDEHRLLAAGPKGARIYFSRR